MGLTQQILLSTAVIDRRIAEHREEAAKLYAEADELQKIADYLNAKKIITSTARTTKRDAHRIKP